jgi:hypothetical protein
LNSDLRDKILSIQKAMKKAIGEAEAISEKKRERLEKKMKVLEERVRRERAFWAPIR